MKLSRTVSYGLKAILQLARSEAAGVPIPCKRLAADGHMPERFLLQILRDLVTHGILESTRGVDGGYSLDRNPEEISLLDVIEAVDGPVISTLPLPGVLPEESRSKLECVMIDVTELARRKFQAIKLAHLLPAADAPESAAG
jgi:Rrf2 family protein